MRFKNIDALGINECCEYLNINRNELPKALNINSQSEIDKLLIERLCNLLNADKIAFRSCSTIKQYEWYLKSWPEGLYLSQALQKIASIKATEKELSFYHDNKNTISGLKEYIKLYPYGTCYWDAKVSLKNKLKKRWICTLAIIISLLIAVCIFTLTNYEPVSYIKMDSNAVLNNIGSEICLNINTDANSSTINVISSAEWLKCRVSGKKLYISGIINPKDERSATVTITANSLFFNKKLSDSQTTTINILQKTGYATKLSLSNNNIRFKSNGGSESIEIDTDGIVAISKQPSWVSASISGNQLHINCTKNTAYIRDGYLMLISGNKRSRIIITQFGGNECQYDPGASIYKVDVDYDHKTNDGHNAMLIHVDFQVDYMQGRTIKVCAFFQDRDGNKMMSSSNSKGQVVAHDTATAPYKCSHWRDFKLEIPVNVLKKGHNRFFIQIQDINGNYLGQSDYYYFKVE